MAITMDITCDITLLSIASQCLYKELQSIATMAIDEAFGYYTQ